MSADHDETTRRGDPAADLARLIAEGPGIGEPGGLDDIPAPTYWPAIRSSVAEGEWEALRSWVEELQARFECLCDHHVIPRCWYRHNGHVEALVALRDYERAAFAPSAPATAAVDFLRALEDVERVLRAWTVELRCGAEHVGESEPLEPSEEDWRAFVAEDIRFRQQYEQAPRRLA